MAFNKIESRYDEATEQTSPTFIGNKPAVEPTPTQQSLNQNTTKFELGNTTDERVKRKALSTNVAERPTTTIAGRTPSELGAEIVTGETSIIGPDQTVSNQVPLMGEEEYAAGAMDPLDPRYNIDTGAGAIDVTAPTTAEEATVQDSRTGTEGSYEVETSADKIDDALAVAAEGELSEEAIITQEEADEIGIDIEATAAGDTAAGAALKDFVSLDIGNVIDTSTVAGKLLANELAEKGETFVDSKATVRGQLEILQKDFVDANGNPTIPTWAAGMYRDTHRMLGMQGISGTAAMGAVAAAIMESSLDIAKADAKLFETITLKNMTNEQESVINRANVLSKFEQDNLDARQEALVTTSKNFLALDLQNLDNEQQAEIVNTQQRTQAIFDDTNAVNIQRKFEAKTEADMQAIYDKLHVEVNKFNAQQRARLAEFSTETDLAVTKFNADLQNDREQFQIKNQILIDESNAKWRQSITTTNTEMVFTAAATDVKNSLAISAEVLNRLWDESDATFDYLWKSTENELDRAQGLSQTIISGEYGESASKRSASATKSAGRSSAIGAAIGAFAAFSDKRLKKNIVKTGESPQGYGYYTWEWNDKAGDLGIQDQPTSGVIAQEVRKVIPEAVFLDRDNGYFMVNYSLLESIAA